MSIEALLWVDLETTGSNEDKDCIIEVGAILTTTDLEAKETWNHVITPTPLGLGRLMQNGVVRPMHEKNGLLADIVERGCGIKPHESEADILHALQDVWGYNPKTVLLAGSGVGHFDRRFIKKQMPKLDNFLHYACLDIGVVRRATELFGYVHPAKGEEPNTKKTHRALDDIELHLKEARIFRNAWMWGLTPKFRKEAS